MSGTATAKRVGLPPHRRTLTVGRVEALAPRMRRIALEGTALDGFASLGPDDHVKLFFPSASGGEAVGRHYTVRRHDRARGEVVIDFVLHGDGPAASWAAAATRGATLSLAGPRSSRLAPDDGTFALLVGDETALPAIGRRLEEMEAGTPVRVLVEIADAGEELHLPTAAQAAFTWVCRDGRDSGSADLLGRSLASLPLPRGPVRAWLAGEIDAVRRLRSHLLVERGLPRDAVTAAGYWRRGEAAAHARIERQDAA